MFVLGYIPIWKLMHQANMEGGILYLRYDLWVTERLLLSRVPCVWEFWGNLYTYIPIINIAISLQWNKHWNEDWVSVTSCCAAHVTVTVYIHIRPIATANWWVTVATVTHQLPVARSNSEKLAQSCDLETDSISIQYHLTDHSLIPDLTGLIYRWGQIKLVYN